MWKSGSFSAFLFVLEVYNDKIVFRIDSPYALLTDSLTQKSVLHSRSYYLQAFSALLPSLLQVVGR